jgi:hypothetical protein
MTMQLPWVESIIDTRSNVHQVQSAICSKVEGKPKLLVLKIDNLLKHVGRYKAKVASPKVKVGSCFFKHDY